MGPWSNEEMNVLVNNAYGDPKTGYSDLVQHKAVTLNVQDTDYDIIKKDIS
jgi:hypothetical protein